jgi:nitrate/nitrite transporter NarK
MQQIHSNTCLASSQVEQRRKSRRIASTPWRICAACLVGLAVAVHYTDYGPLIPVMLTDLHIEASQAGLMSTMLFLGLAITYVPGGILVDRYGQQPVLLGATLLMALGGVILPLWPNIYWILACRTLIGFGSGAAFIAAAGIVSTVEKHTALAQGLYGGFIQIGSGLGLLVTPALANWAGWQWAFLSWGLLSVPAVLFWFFLQDERPVQPEKKADVMAGLRSPAVWSLGLSHMGTFGVGNVISAWIAVYLVHQYGIPLGMAAAFGAGGLTLGALIRPLGGILLGQKIFAAVALLRTSTILTCLGVGLLALPVHLTLLALLGMGAVAIGSTLPYTSVYDNAAHLRTVSKGVAQGLISVIACQPILWGPPLIGLLFQSTGNFSLPFGSLLFFCAIAINASLLAGITLRYEKRREKTLDFITRRKRGHLTP